MVIGLEQEITNFNNLTAADQLLAGRQIMRAVWPTCVRVRPDFSFEPYFCESLPTVITEDPLVVEYRLREDAAWSDGTPVSSDDLVFFFENCNEAGDDCGSTAGFDSADLEVVDDKAVRLSWPALRGVYPALLRPVPARPSGSRLERGLPCRHGRRCRPLCGGRVQPGQRSDSTSWPRPESRSPSTTCPAARSSDPSSAPTTTRQARRETSIWPSSPGSAVPCPRPQPPRCSESAVRPTWGLRR